MVFVINRLRLLKASVSVGMILLGGHAMSSNAETLSETCPPLVNGKAPETFEELWAGIDPRSEPLDVEILKEWDVDGVIIQVLRYRIGIFNGQKAMMAAVYGYPKGGTSLPGLVQIHGGGQYAQYQACVSNAKRGYATLSIAWAGRLSAYDYQVNPNGVKLYWEGKTNDPAYKVTTDWGGVDAYHAPSRYEGSDFTMNNRSPKKLDPVDSPRNSGWFLSTIGARRGLTFLEQQPEVDPDKLGVYGHSMGGKLTVMTAGTDDRVKAAAPSCGGVSDRYQDSVTFKNLLTDNVYLSHISCPVVFLSPANDFHGRINDLPASVTELGENAWRVTCSAHHNHQDTANYEVATQIWFDQHLKGTYEVPQTSSTELTLNNPDGVPSLKIIADESKPIKHIDVYYTQHGQEEGKHNNTPNTVARFWRHASPEKQGDAWIADLPLISADKPLWVYANVYYSLEESIRGVGYYYGAYETDTYNLSSLIHLVSSDEVKAAGVTATLSPTLLIESFDGNWEKEWFTYRLKEWGRSTHKLYDEQYRAPDSATLAFDVRAKEGKKVVVSLDGFSAEVALEGASDWKSISLRPSDFNDAEGEVLNGWSKVRTLSLSESSMLRSKGKEPIPLGEKWEGEAAQFRTLRWVPRTSS